MVLNNNSLQKLGIAIQLQLLNQMKDAGEINVFHREREYISFTQVKDAGEINVFHREDEYIDLSPTSRVNNEIVDYGLSELSSLKLIIPIKRKKSKM